MHFLADESCDFAVVRAFASPATTWSPSQSWSQVLVRYPANARRSVGAAVVRAVTELAGRLVGGFVVVEPGRARVSPTPR